MSMFRLRKLGPLLVASGVVCCLAPAPARADLVLTAEAPGVQATTVSGVITETFDSFAQGQYSTLNTAVGTFSAPGLAVRNANIFGGAGGTGRYFEVGVQSGTLMTTLTLSMGVAQSYFGFWWSAADAGNAIELYSGGSLLASFNPATALGALTNPAYFDNPNSNFSGNVNEKYAYLNFVGTNGTTFDQIVFKNASRNSGFEADNFSIRQAPIVGPPPGTIIDGGVTVVPEPGTVASGLLACVAGLFVSRKRLKRQLATSL